MSSAIIKVSKSFTSKALCVPKYQIPYFNCLGGIVYLDQNRAQPSRKDVRQLTKVESGGLLELQRYMSVKS